MMTYYYCSECDNTVTLGHECKAFITPPDIKKELNMNESKSYMNPAGYVDPASKYYIDRMWEEYHKVKEELADTKCKLVQSEDYINETLKPQLAETKSKLKMAQNAWDLLDKSHAERAKLHDELVIAEGQRDALRTDKKLLEDACANACEIIGKLEAERDALKTFVSAFTQWSSKYNTYNAVPMKDARADFETLMEAYNTLTVQPSTDTWEDTRARCS